MDIEKMYTDSMRIRNKINIDLYTDILSMSYSSWALWQMLLIYIGYFIPNVDVTCISPDYFNNDDDYDARADIVFPYQSILNTLIYKAEDIGDYKVENSYNNDHNNVGKWLQSYDDDALIKAIDLKSLDSWDDNVITIISSNILGLFFKKASAEAIKHIQNMFEQKFEIFNYEESVLLSGEKILITDKSFYFISKKDAEYYDVYTDANPCALVLLKYAYDYAERNIGGS